MRVRALILLSPDHVRSRSPIPLSGSSILTLSHDGHLFIVTDARNPSLIHHPGCPCRFPALTNSPVARWSTNSNGDATIITVQPDQTNDSRLFLSPSISIFE